VKRRMQHTHYPAVAPEHLGERPICVVDHDQSLGIGRMTSELFENGAAAEFPGVLMGDVEGRFGE
jgi:hypothetical protein